MVKPILVLLIENDDEENHQFLNIILQKIFQPIESTSERNAEEALMARTVFLFLILCSLIQYVPHAWHVVP
jgi:hypothetical protein